MTEAQKQRLERQLWNIANELRGKMDADEFRDYILGFIFFKYLSEKQNIFANKLLETEDVKSYADVTDEGDLEAIREESLEKLGYFLKPAEMFSAIAKRMPLVRRLARLAHSIKQEALIACVDKGVDALGHHR